jgi:hypothetical protein
MLFGKPSYHAIRSVPRIGDASLVLPELREPIRRPCRISRGRLQIAMPKVVRGQPSGVSFSTPSAVNPSPSVALHFQQ